MSLKYYIGAVVLVVVVYLLFFKKPQVVEQWGYKKPPSYTEWLQSMYGRMYGRKPQPRRPSRKTSRPPPQRSRPPPQRSRPPPRRKR